MSDAPLNNRDLERVIARAMEIDALGRPQTREALLKVAAQLHISPAAIDKALAEVLAGGAPLGHSRGADAAGLRGGPATSKVHPWLTAASVSIGITAGVVTGASYDLVRGDGATIAAILLLLASSAGLVWTHRDERKPLSMMARTAALWASFVYAWVTGHGEALSWFVDTTSIAAGASIVAGAAVHMGRQAWLRLRQRASSRQSLPTTMLDVFTPVPGPYHTPV